MATPQTIVVGNIPAPQSSVGLQPAYQQSNNENFRRNKNTVRGLAITEIVLGSLCMLISILILAVPSYKYRSRYLSRISIGEGLWCGVWVVIAGGLGIPTAYKNVSRCMINCHLAFSIVGAVFAAVMFSLGVTLLIININLSITFRIILYCFEALFALASMILCIISASYCCLLLGCCCQTMSSQSFGTQMYQQQPQILGQGASGYQQGYVMQTQPNSQPMPATASDSTYSFPTQQLTPNDQNEQPGLAQKQAEAMDNPPSYPNVA